MTGLSIVVLPTVNPMHINLDRAIEQQNFGNPVAHAPSVAFPSVIPTSNGVCRFCTYFQGVDHPHTDTGRKWGNGRSYYSCLERRVRFA